jgi:DNA polymerase-3 subunit alpha
MSFVHLHTHSHYSLLDGVPKIPELIAAAKERDMPAIALTDHGNMYGAIEFYQEATKAGVKPIIGLEAYVAPEGMREKAPKERPYHMILLAKNYTGYQNLIELVSKANLEGFYRKPRIDIDLLRTHSEGLIGLSGCLSGHVARSLMTNGAKATEEVVKQYQDIFGPDHYYLEVQSNPNTPEQSTVNAGLLELHRSLGTPLVATNDVHYINPDDKEAQDVMLCIQTKNLLANQDRFTMSHEDYSLTPAEEMEELFKEYPGACENTVKIAEMVNIDITLGEIQTPHFELPDGVTDTGYLRELCDAGLKRRYDETTPEIRERLEYELDVISKTGFSSYFLIVQDFIMWAKNRNIAVGPGRGSAAGSLVAYLTGITDIDPIKYDLLFERFLNPERVSQPDVDTDFADIRRDDVLTYVEEKYGKDHVAQIITFGTMAARASIRDVGRVLGLSYGYCDRISKLIPMFTTLDQAIAQVPELSELINQDADAQRLIAIARKLEGVVRHTSTHACAVVITKEPLTTQIPLQKDQDGAIITQYSMNPVDNLGLLKMDFLGLKNLTIIEKTLEIVEATTGDVIDIEKLPLDDKPTFKLLQQANTVGIFQMESSGMRRYLRQLKPTEFEDIIAMVSLYRPGPMEFIPQYIDGKHGKREVTYIDERLKPILEKTYGIAVYQEQVLEIARQLAGYSYGEADILRKAVGKKIKKMLDEQEYKMIEGMMKNGISSKVAKEIWEFILPFARYGFNRSHAACYAMIGYRTAYLKAHYPAQFMAALMTSDADNTERIALEIQHARDLNLVVLPPDVNESFGTFAVVKSTLTSEQPEIRYGLHAVKNVGSHIIDVIVSQRKEGGEFTSIEDFLQRCSDRDLNKKSLESLIKVGALDRFGQRNQLLENMETLLQFNKRAEQEARTGQRNLFAGGDAAKSLPNLTLSPAPAVADRTRLDWEKELLGVYISGHPLETYREIIDQLSTSFAELKEMKSRTETTVIALIESVKQVTTKKGDRMAFAQIADYTGEVEALVFPKTFAKTSAIWNENAVVKIVGKTDKKDGSLKILVEEAELFDPSAKREIHIHVPEQLSKALFERMKGMMDRTPGAYLVHLKAGEKLINTKQFVDKSIQEDLERILGPETVDVIH